MTSREIKEAQQQQAALILAESWLYYYPHLHLLICTSYGYAVADLASYL